MCGHKAFQRYFAKFDRAINHRVFAKLFQWFFSNFYFDKYTLDFDSTIMTRYGRQDGAAKGYNPKKTGRNFHHPLMAFMHECRMITNFWLRSGNSYLPITFCPSWKIPLRSSKAKTLGSYVPIADFTLREILDYTENRTEAINYIIAVKFYRPIKLKPAYERTWMKLGEGIEIAETTCQADNWEIPRRPVMVRQDMNKRPNACGKQLFLFPEEHQYCDYIYSCFITNMDLSAKMIYDMYRNRADAENRIKEVKEDFGASSFVNHNLWATEPPSTLL
jgi:hypothetical protein